MGHANHGRPNDLVMKQVARLHLADNDSFLMLSRFHPLDRVMKMRVELLPHRINAHEPLLRQRLPQLAADQLETLAVFPTVETLVAQLIAAVLVIGSYYAARRFGGGPAGGATVEAHAPSMAAINA